jgi:hypothetical protein
VAAAEDYQRLPLSLYGQFLATPGAANGTAGAARVEITGAAGVPATVDATLDGDHLTFTLPASIAPPEPGAPISLTVAVVRGSVRSSRTLPLTLTAADPAAVNGHGRVVPSSPA